MSLSCPQRRGHGRGVVQLVRESYQQALAVRPYGVVGAAQHRGAQLLLRHAEGAAKGNGVHAPFVLAPAPGAGAVKQHLAVEWLDAPEVQDVRADCPEALQDRGVVGDRSEQQRLGVRGHHATRRVSATSGAYGGSSGLMRGSVCVLIHDLLCFGYRSAKVPLRKSKHKVRHGPRRNRWAPPAGTPRARLAHRPTDHGGPGPAGRRWTLRVLWELRDGSAASFRELRERCDNMSTSVLNQRLSELRDAGLIHTTAGGYSLTKQGMELQEAPSPTERLVKALASAPAGRG